MIFDLRVNLCDKCIRPGVPFWGHGRPFEWTHELMEDATHVIAHLATLGLNKYFVSILSNQNVPAEGARVLSAQGCVDTLIATCSMYSSKAQSGEIGHNEWPWGQVFARKVAHPA